MQRSVKVQHSTANESKRMQPIEYGIIPILYMIFLVIKWSISNVMVAASFSSYSWKNSPFGRCNEWNIETYKETLRRPLNKRNGVFADRKQMKIATNQSRRVRQLQLANCAIIIMLHTVIFQQVSSSINY